MKKLFAILYMYFKGYTYISDGEFVKREMIKKDVQL